MFFNRYNVIIMTRYFAVYYNLTVHNDAKIARFVFSFSFFFPPVFLNLSVTTMKRAFARFAFSSRNYRPRRRFRRGRHFPESVSFLYYLWSSLRGYNNKTFLGFPRLFFFNSYNNIYLFLLLFVFIYFFR